MADQTGKMASDHVEDAVSPDLQEDKITMPNNIPSFLIGLSVEEIKAIEKKLVRKVDIRLLIMMVVMYILNYLDRNNIAAAKLAGLEKSLNLKGDQYQLCVSILFVGYLLMQGMNAAFLFDDSLLMKDIIVPSNMILNKFGKPSIYLPACMVVWGVISTATAATTSFRGLLVCRFFLGFVEAAYFPGCLYLLSSWYTRKELVKRTALLYSGSLLSGAFSGLISAGITSGLNGARGLAAWKWLFIIEGSLTIFVAIFSFFIVPDLPRTTPWLTEDEKILAAWRLEVDIGEDDWVDSKHQSMFYGAKLAFNVMAGLGRNNIDTLLLTTPPYLIGTIFVLINAWHADKTGERYLHIICPPMLGIVSFILSVSTTSFAARYVAMCIMLAGCYGGYVVCLGYISNILPRPATKRAAALALINSLSNVCQIYTPYLYPIAFVVNIGMLSMTIFFATIMRMLLARLNKKLDDEEGTNLGRDAHQREEHGLPGHAAAQGFRFLL
ncbi:uncharacterized protein BHQ10_003168 [Talaromyces amestolkiae]|uniref:Major facilitator superfamily (MFS) profile domain-containing protein n=1 Tax=Talaromyces amestolkiae TaxID=1196081 RepID=A0A364KUC2_TALAM|nr:uncharacterized protein BHQ10_003168 [Talaromyces amestolkiae]RAO67156.1 hypothetical protein BHQ10_003168 [Talaromyces amestolkiae]